MIASLFLLIFVLISNVSARIGCKGLNGEKVDWFVAYKLPSRVKDANQGKAFMYADNKNLSLIRSKKNIDDSGIAVGATITQAYKEDKSSFSFMYNDDSPTGKSEGYRGHAKGVVLFDSSTGFWMIHSVPNFPPTSSYSYPQTAVKYAQSFICVTLNTENLNVIGDHLRFIQATPFQYNLPEKFATQFPVLRQVLAKQSLPKSATVFTATKHMKTSDGAAIHAFAKHKKFNTVHIMTAIAPNYDADVHDLKGKILELKNQLPEFDKFKRFVVDTLDDESYQKRLTGLTKQRIDILKACNRINTNHTNRYYYCDPANFTAPEEQKKLVLGGIVAIWGEFVDDTNIEARSWPRASAAAERLWSSPESTKLAAVV